MGTCMCKDRHQSNRNSHSQTNNNPLEYTISLNQQNSVNPILNRETTCHSDFDLEKLTKFVQHVDSLVLETLTVIKTLVDNDQQPPRSMLILHKIADKEPGWLTVVSSLVHMIPLDNPLGPAVITMLIDECPIPSKEAMLKLTKMLKVNRDRQSNVSDAMPQIERNICVVLGCLAEKLAGPSSVYLLTKDVLQYLLINLKTICHPVVILQAIVALEKFSQTSENKATISHALNAIKPHPLLALEKFTNSSVFPKQEVAFSAQWCLDNLFLIEGRPLTYEMVSLTNVNVMLNGNDVSEYLKISPDGLQARCDAASFESVRCTFQVDTGRWYYEVTVVSAGVMQIGWATKDSKFLNHEGYGIGDDSCSIAYDGCRQLLWYEAHSTPIDHPPWQPGDVLGMVLDIDNKVCTFTLNGQHNITHSTIFENTRSRFFAAASFMSFQQCRFNFGSHDFKFPPKCDFKAFNSYGELGDDEKVILPRHKKLALLHMNSINEFTCTICCDKTATIMLQPCKHRGFCADCTKQMEICPVCRQTIIERQEMSPSLRTSKESHKSRKTSNESISSWTIGRSSTSSRRDAPGKSNLSANNIYFGTDWEVSFSDENNDILTDCSFKIFDKDRSFNCDVCFGGSGLCKCGSDRKGDKFCRGNVVKGDNLSRVNLNDAEKSRNSNCDKRDKEMGYCKGGNVDSKDRESSKGDNIDGENVDVDDVRILIDKNVRKRNLKDLELNAESQNYNAVGNSEICHSNSARICRNVKSCRNYHKSDSRNSCEKCRTVSPSEYSSALNSSSQNVGCSTKTCTYCTKPKYTSFNSQNNCTYSQSNQNIHTANSCENDAENICHSTTSCDSSAQNCSSTMHCLTQCSMVDTHCSVPDSTQNAHVNDQIIEPICCMNQNIKTNSKFDSPNFDCDHLIVSDLPVDISVDNS